MALFWTLDHLRRRLRAALGDGIAARWLETIIFPKVVAYATHAYTIAATMLLLIPLIAWANNTAISLILGNYTNVVSASVASIVLATSLKQHHENRARHDAHAQQIADLHAKVDALAAKKPARNVAVKVEETP